jgi:hypothetical protein
MSARDRHSTENRPLVHAIAVDAASRLRARRADVETVDLSRTRVDRSAWLRTWLSDTDG